MDVGKAGRVPWGMFLGTRPHHGLSSFSARVEGCVCVLWGLGNMRHSYLLRLLRLLHALEAGHGVRWPLIWVPTHEVTWNQAFLLKPRKHPLWRLTSFSGLSHPLPDNCHHPMDSLWGQKALQKLKDPIGKDT